jgi:hypothetical protein
MVVIQYAAHGMQHREKTPLVRLSTLACLCVFRDQSALRIEFDTLTGRMLAYRLRLLGTVTICDIGTVACDDPSCSDNPTRHVLSFFDAGRNR